jgi:hypothetical protein
MAANCNGKRQRQTATANGNGKRQRQTATANGNGKRQQLGGLLQQGRGAVVPPQPAQRPARRRDHAGIAPLL